MTRLHNEFRSKTAKENGAADMMKMKWDYTAANVAQKWADQCEFKHSTNKYGENLFVTTAQDVYKAMDQSVNSWFNEVRFYNYNYDCYSDSCFKKVGHYTQLVWAKTSLLGCGIRKCNKVIGTVMSNAYLVVCNYSPAGNIMKNKILNKPYTKGKPCSKCPGYCTSESLCRKIPAKRTLYDLLSRITDTKSDWNVENEEDLEDQRKERRNEEKEED
ncbi:peptidase inhibitor 16 [Mytilus galloprovincialis]|uniref:Peptidase inhibitor 16 n=1 Tax=Mytilus galloprovincialis TaxID=29158 RepID=A0A8B6BTV3_MYTGA|nr:peptidase inhibitor 16 [Mytilus galloprovincialis]